MSEPEGNRRVSDYENTFGHFRCEVKVIVRVCATPENMGSKKEMWCECRIFLAKNVSDSRKLNPKLKSKYSINHLF